MQVAQFDRQTDRGIQLLRISACLAVFFCHFGQRLGLETISTNLYHFSQLGRFGVELFFVVSGYLACFSLSNGKSISQYYKKRIIRILPLYYFCILYFFATETFIFRSVPDDPMHLGWLRYIFCLNGIVPSAGYFWSNIGITWTIPVFVMFYLLAPFFVKYANSTLRAAIILVISIGVSYITQTKTHGWFSSFSYMPCFLMGVAVYNAKKEQHRFVAALCFQLYVFTMKFCTWNGFIEKAVSLSNLMIISAIFSTIILVADGVVIYNSRITKILDILDEHSYTFYLVHGITFCGIIDKFAVETFSNILYAIGFRLFVSVIGTFILTVIVHKYVELPLQKCFRSLLLN